MNQDSAKVNGRAAGGLEMVENHKIVDEMGREWTVWAENQLNRSATALRTPRPNRFIPYCHPGSGQSQKVENASLHCKNAFFSI